MRVRKYTQENKNIRRIMRDDITIKEFGDKYFTSKRLYESFYDTGLFDSFKECKECREDSLSDLAISQVFDSMFFNADTMKYTTEKYYSSDPVSEIFDTEYPILLGDPNRSSDIIEVLETMGGKNVNGWSGNSPDGAYGINQRGEITCVAIREINDDVLKWAQKIEDFLSLK